MLDPYAFLEDAFPNNKADDFPVLKDNIRAIIKAVPQSKDTFKRISTYIVSLQQRGEEGHAQKKRRLDTSTAPQSSIPSSPPPKTDKTKASTQSSVLTIPDISFSLPARKKFTLEITTASIVLHNTAGGSKELEVPYTDLNYIVCLPVPDKAARQYNFCLFPKQAPGSDVKPDAIVWTVPVAIPKTLPEDAFKSLKQDDPTEFQVLLTNILNTHLPQDLSVSLPDADIFRSANIQPHRKSEVAFHVKAHRGTKEGYLFFLSNAIIWAFKKPLYCFFFHHIESVSYSDITMRTFNLHVATTQEDGDGGELEFAMIDQSEFAGIDAYVKKNQLQDASMAAKRKAQRHHVNGKPKGDEDGEEQEEQERENGGELKKAFSELQNQRGGDDDDDDDEEDDEDYQAPDSDDDDGGSGSESSDEDGGGNDNDNDDEGDDDDDDEEHHSHMEED